MLISQEEMMRRLRSNRNLANTLPAADAEKKINVVVPTPTPKPPPLPDNIRATIGSLARQGEKVVDIASQFNCTPGQVRAANDSTNPAIQAKISASIERVRELALEKLMISLGLMTEEKFENASLKELAATAASLGKLIEKTSPRESGTPLQLIVYAPQQREQHHYKVVDV